MRSRQPFSEVIWDAGELELHDATVEKTVRTALRKQLVRMQSRSDFFRPALAGVGRVAAADILRFHDALPMTDKADLLRDQEDHPPFGSFLATSRDRIRRVHRTSGTSGKPLWLAMTARDIATTYECGARCFYAAGLRPGQLAINCMNYCAWAGGYTDHGSMETVGAAVLPFGVGNSRVMIQTVLDLGLDTLQCTPSYLPKLRVILADEFGLQPADLGLKLGLFGGEGGLQDPEFRRRLEAEWGFRAMNANYGMSDVLSMFGAECHERTGLHFMGQGALHVTLIDPVTRAPRHIEDGAQGELVLTSLVKEAQPVVRYRTHDMIRIIATSRCACGRGSFRFQVLGRSDDMLVVRGINLFPGAVASVISRHLAQLTGEYMVLVNRIDPIDRLVLRVETRRGVQADPLLGARLQSDLLQSLSVRAEVELVDDGTLPKTEGKAVRVSRIL